MSYDSWKTRSPDDEAPVCDICGGYLHREACTGDLYCPECDQEDDEYVEMLAFYQWEPLPCAAT